MASAAFQVEWIHVLVESRRITDMTDLDARPKGLSAVRGDRKSQPKFIVLRITTSIEPRDTHHPIGIDGNRWPKRIRAERRVTASHVVVDHGGREPTSPPVVRMRHHNLAPAVAL